MYPDLNLFINGKWRKTKNDLPVINPATEEEIGRLPCAGRKDLDDVLASAEIGHKIWSRTGPRDRSDIIMKAAELMRKRQEQIAHAITIENGKPLQQARMEVIRGAEFFEWDAGEALRTYGRTLPARHGHKISVHHHPIGVVSAYSPWNFPMSQPARKIAGALASGCSIILKVAEETPTGAVHIAQAFMDAGLPAGVLNLIFGIPSEISNYLIPQKSVKLIAFTGSTKIGRHLTTLASEPPTRDKLWKPRGSTLTDRPIQFHWRVVNAQTIILPLLIDHSHKDSNSANGISSASCSSTSPRPFALAFSFFITWIYCFI